MTLAQAPRRRRRPNGAAEREGVLMLRRFVPTRSWSAVPNKERSWEWVPLTSTSLVFRQQVHRTHRAGDPGARRGRHDPSTRPALRDERRRRRRDDTASRRHRRRGRSPALSIDITQPGALGPEDAEEVGDDLPANSGPPDRVREPLGRESGRRSAGCGRRVDRTRSDPGRRSGSVRGKLTPPFEIERNDMGLVRMAGLAPPSSGNGHRCVRTPWSVVEAAR